MGIGDALKNLGPKTCSNILCVCIVYSSTYDMCVVEITKAFPRTNFEKDKTIKKGRTHYLL